MKKLKRVLIVVIVAILSTISLNAQNKEGKEKIEAMKVAFITEKLDLTEQEAKDFWPVYNQMEEELAALRPEKGEKNNLDELNDQEIENLIQERFSKEQRKLQVKMNYFEKFKSILPMQKIGMLYKTEHSFRKEVLSKFKERKEQPFKN